LSSCHIVGDRGVPGSDAGSSCCDNFGKNFFSYIGLTVY